MQPIHSGTTTERVVRSVIPTLVVVGLAVAFLWDGYIGYPRDNALQFSRKAGLDTSALPPIDWNLSADTARPLVEQLPSGTPISRVHAALGQPAIEHGDELYYLGPTGRIVVRRAGDVVAQIGWLDGVHSATDLAVQRWLGYVLLVVAMALLINLARVVRTRISLTDAGLEISAGRLIPCDAVKALRLDPTAKGEVVEIVYAAGDGKECTAKLDAYVVKHFSAIVGGLSERAGLPNPLAEAPPRTS